MSYHCLFYSRILLYLLLLPGIGAAADQRATPTPYGLKYYRSTELALQAPVRLLRSAPDAALYRSRVEDAELANGPYSSALGELLADEAAYLQAQGDHAAAITSLRRAVHVTRINDGLHSGMQVPMVRRLFSNYLAIRELELADDMQQYLYFLHSESQHPTSAQHIAAVVELADWRRKTWLVELHDRDIKRWHESYRLIDRALDELQALEAPPLPQLELLTYAFVRQLYLLGEGQFGVQEELQMALNRGFSDPNNPQMSHAERQMQSLQRGAYKRGTSLLEQVSSAQASAGNSLSQARAELYLADWHIWHNYSKRAQQNYRQCWQLLALPELVHLRGQWFAQPLELPVDDVFFAGAQVLPENTAWVPVTMRFTVSAQGKPRDIETLVAPQEHEGLGYRLHRWLRAARYRPALEMGEPVASAPLEREYLVAD